ncbi:MAG: type II toxin-antitoxin system HipA family toxin [Oligoflexus sp.]
MNPLNIFYENQHVGEFLPDASLHLDFVYDKNWLKNSDAFPISLAMPLDDCIYKYPKPTVFLENLLPEEKIRRSVEQANRLPKDNPYQFLKEFGEDLAGAFTISEYEKPLIKESKLVPISWDYVGKAVKSGQTLYQSISHDFGAKFSLAGAQDKFCVIYKDDQLFVSQGSDPTTHIAKVNLDFRNSQTVFNEYFCMTLASKIGLEVPQVTLVSEPEPILLIKRFDRIEENGVIKRIHQEDFCQAQSIASGLKYEDRGGPTASQNYSLIRAFSARPIKDLEAYLNWIAFNLIIGNNDSHSKNLSFIYRGRKVVLAPFYDLLSTAVYGHRFSSQFAFRIGNTANYDKIRNSDIEQFEASIGVRRGKFIKNFSRVSRLVEDKLQDVMEQLKELAPSATIGQRIYREIEKRLRHFRGHGGLQI